MVIGNCNKIWFTEIDLSLKNMSRWGEGGGQFPIYTYTISNTIQVSISGPLGFLVSNQPV